MCWICVGFVGKMYLSAGFFSAYAGLFKYKFSVAFFIFSISSWKKIISFASSSMLNLRISMSCLIFWNASFMESMQSSEDSGIKDYLEFLITFIRLVYFVAKFPPSSFKILNALAVLFYF